MLTEIKAGKVSISCDLGGETETERKENVEMFAKLVIGLNKAIEEDS